MEVFGYHQLHLDESKLLEDLFSYLDVLYLTPNTYEIGIELRQRRKMTLADALIAATALEHHLVLATHNTKDFSDILVKIVDPLTLIQ